MITPQLIEEYLLDRDTCEHYARQVRHKGGLLAAFLAGREPTYKLLNEWLTTVSGSPKTRRHYRSTALALWNYAADLGLCDRPDGRRVRRIKVKPNPPIAWTPDEVERLLEAARSDADATYWVAYIRVSYETGLRRGDALSLTEVSSRPFLVVEAKTGFSQAKQCTEATVSYVRDAGGLQSPWPAETWYRKARRLITKAGLTGTMKRLRKTHGSLVGGLGHGNEATFRKHYYDPRLTQAVAMPPDLEN